MNRFHRKFAGGLLAAGIVTGAFAGAVPLAGGSGLQLIPTTTTVNSTPAPSANDVYVLSATVNLAAIHGALVTPSGAVSFTGSNPDFTGGHIFLFGAAPVTRCLLGLPSLLDLYSASCTATDIVQTGLLANDPCGWTIYANYSGGTDLVAKSSEGQAPLHSCAP